MTLFSKKQAKGFTIIETLATIFIFSIIMIGTTLLLRELFRNSNQESLALDVVDQSRIITFNFISELRNANSGNDGSYPLNQAGNSQIVFYSTFGSPTSTQINRIRYYIASSTLYKGVTAPSGNPLTYNLASEKITSLVANVVNATTSPIFYYYDGNYAGTSTPLAQPINVNNVKFVSINLVLLKQDIRNGTSTFSINTGGTIRNLKTNLGN